MCRKKGGITSTRCDATAAESVQTAEACNTINVCTTVITHSKKNLLIL